MVAARSQSLANEMVIVYLSSFFCRLLPVSVDEVYSVTWIGCILRRRCPCHHFFFVRSVFQNLIAD